MRNRFAALAAPLAGAAAVLLPLAGCATTSASTPAVTPVAAVQPATPVGPGDMLARAGHPDAPTLAVLQRTFGPPDIERREGSGAILTYRLETCALVLVFTADPRNEFRLAEASAQPARPGLQAPALADCAAAAQSRVRAS